MTVNVLFFSVLRDLVGADHLSLSLEAGGGDVALGEILARIYADYPALQGWDNSLLLAVNAEFATRDSLVHEGDEIALMPPVQGG